MDCLVRLMSSTGSPAAIGEGMGRFGSHEAEASRMLWLSHSSLGARTLLGAPGLTTRNKNPTRSMNHFSRLFSVLGVELCLLRFFDGSLSGRQEAVALERGQEGLGGRCSVPPFVTMPAPNVAYRMVFPPKALGQPN